MTRSLDGLDALRFIQKIADESRRRGRRLTEEEQEELLYKEFGQKSEYIEPIQQGDHP